MRPCVIVESQTQMFKTLTPFSGVTVTFCTEHTVHSLKIQIQMNAVGVLNCLALYTQRTHVVEAGEQCGCSLVD